MPFLARLWAQEKRYEFATGIADAVSRAVSLGLLAASAMVALAHPIAGLIFGGGRFSEDDVHLTALYFALYVLSLAFWAAQSIYARAFYAAGITWLPLLASTVIVVAAFPLYGMGFQFFKAGGLALASDCGIALQAVVLGYLLHRRHMVSLASLEYREMARCVFASLASGGLVWFVFGFGWNTIAEWLGPRFMHPSRWIDLAILVAGSAIWMLLAKTFLEASGSMLPQVMLKRVLKRR